MKKEMKKEVRQLLKDVEPDVILLRDEGIKKIKDFYWQKKADRIKKYRESLNLSIRAFCRKFELDFSNHSKMERGLSCPDKTYKMFFKD